jgi:hypothetical protein
MVWNPYDAPCDYFKLGGKRSPGIAEIVGAASVRNWDKREGYALTGSFSVFRGRGLAEFSARIRLYTIADWDAWHAWKPIVDKLPTSRGGRGPASGCLDIWHPLLEELDIKSVGVAKVKQPEQTGDGEWTIEIEFIEFRHPKVTLAQPDSAASTPVDPIEEEIIKPLTNKLQVEMAAAND